MQLMGFGRTLSGQLLFRPIDEATAAQQLLQNMQRNVAGMRALGTLTARGMTFRGEVRRRTLDAGDPVTAGWSFLVSGNDPRRQQIAEILEPLAKHRGMEDPTEPLVLESANEDTFSDWLQDHYFARELEGKKIPHYVLMVGGPEVLPFRLQALLSSVCSVGRLDFDSLDQLKAYVDKVIRLESAAEPSVARRAFVFAPDGGSQDPTYFSRKYMAEPIALHIKEKFQLDVTALMGEEATKKQLLAGLRGARPALVYTASHGLGAMGEPLEVQKRYNGAICCQTHAELTVEDLLCGDDVPGPDEPFLEGAVMVQFACYGAGTPATSDYAHWLTGVPEKCAETDFVAHLPKALLAHPRGPVAFIGHLDTAFLHGFTDEKQPHILERWHARIQPFLHIVQQLLEVQPSGLAMEDMSRKFSVYNAMLASTYDRQRAGKFVFTPELAERFLDCWIIRNDAQNFMVLGDPAARLRIPD